MSDIRNASKVGRLTFLSDEKKRDIYLAALEICATIGMRVYHVEVEQMLMEAGCTKTPDERVLMPRHLIEQARLSVPACVNVYDRDGVLALELGGYNSYFGTGSDLMSTYDLETKEHRPSTLDDVRRAARLCDALPHMDFVMSSAHPKEVDPHRSYLLSFQAMMESTRKPLVMTAENAGDLGVMIEIARELRGGADPLPSEALLRGLQRADQPTGTPDREPGEAAPLRGHRSARPSTRPLRSPGPPPPSRWPATSPKGSPRASSAW